MSYLQAMYKDALPVVIDFETTSRHKGDYFGATPYDHANHVVLGGILVDGDKGLYFGDHSKGCTTKHHALYTLLNHLIDVYASLSPPRKMLLIGVNIGFDLSHIMHNAPATWNTLRKGLIIWDCSAAEYFLSGQLDKYPSMNKMAERYKLSQKPDTLKSYMEAGVDVEDIPVSELHDYLRHDLVTTMGIFNSQMGRFHGNIPDAYLVKMEDILMTTTMEVNGMHFDKGVADELAMTTMEELGMLEEMLTREAQSITGLSEFKINSNTQLSTLIYGGAFKVDTADTCFDVDGNPIVYKSGVKKGLVKTKKGEKLVPFGGILTPTTPFVDKTVDEERLRTFIADKSLPHSLIIFIEDLLKARVLRKDLSTYYIGYAKFAELDGLLHTSLNQTATGTGRLSSSRPNLQNCAHNTED